jgi:hypothetical protein
MKKLSVISLMFGFSLIALCQQPRPAHVPANPSPIEFEQPNGDILTIRLIGDERMHFNTTIDGYVVVKNKKGYFCYAKLDKNDNFAPSRRIAHNADKRGKSENKFLKKMATNPKLKKDMHYY